MKQFLSFILLLSLVTGYSFAQDNVKEVPNLPNYYSIGSDPSTATLTSEAPQVQSNPYLTEVVSKLKEARTLNNSVLVDKYAGELNRISGSSTTTGQDPNVSTPILLSSNRSNPPFNEGDMNSKLIYNIPNWCIATATVPVGAPGAGDIYAASGNYNPTVSDTMRIYRSINGGVSWTVVTGFLYGGADNYNFVANDLDIEIISNTTNSWLYLVCRVNNATTGTHFIQGFRVQLQSAAATFFNLAFPGANANNNYYNLRVTSDSPIWTSGAFVYFLSSFDTLDGAQRRCRQKFALVTSPYLAAITVTYRGPGPGGGWNWHTAVPAGSYYAGDICYISAATDRILTVANFPTTVAFPSMYLAWSNDYGVTIQPTISITEPVANVTFGARIASNGNANQNMMITYTRQFSGTDWDPYFRRTTNGGTTTGDWTGGYVDASTARSRYVDVIGVTNGAGLFKAAYVQDSTNSIGGRNFLYRSYTAGVWGGSYRVADFTPDTSFGKIRAGYRNGGGDDCFSVWASGNGADVRCSYACLSTVGIQGNGNELPNVYSLSQNYPNPFNPTTNFKFTIPNAGLVNLVVYDIMGREVAIVVNQNMTAGSYSVDFDASKLSSGVYFYKLTSGSFTDAKKMMLIK